MKLYSLLIFIFCTHFIFGQTDHAKLIFVDGTSIEGLASIKNNKILFRLSEEDTADEWDEALVSQIIFYGPETVFIYEYLQINKNTKPQLMEVIDDGEVVLYSDFTRRKNGWNNLSDYFKSPKRMFSLNSLGFQEDAPDIYIKRKYEKFPIDLNYNFKKHVLDYFSNCESLVEKIIKGIYRKNDIDKIVDYYNVNCAE
jgi:hypothetical protein